MGFMRGDYGEVMGEFEGTVMSNRVKNREKDGSKGRWSNKKSG